MPKPNEQKHWLDSLSCVITFLYPCNKTLLNPFAQVIHITNML